MDVLERPVDGVGLNGWVEAIVRDAEGNIKQRVTSHNLITETGDTYYGNRAANAGTIPAQATGMRLGTNGPTAVAVAKTGAGAAIVGYIAGSSIAIDAGYPTSALSAGKRRIAWHTTWPADTATSTTINEAVITNETPLTDVAGVAGNTISRVVFGTTIAKSATDSLQLSWFHDLLGA